MGCTDSKPGGQGAARGGAKQAPAAAPQKQPAKVKSEQKENHNTNQTTTTTTTSSTTGHLRENGTKSPENEEVQSSQMLSVRKERSLGVNSAVSDEQSATVAQIKPEQMPNDPHVTLPTPESSDPDSPAAMMIELPSFRNIAAQRSPDTTTAQSPFMANSCSSPPQMSVSAAQSGRQKLPGTKSQFSPLLGPKQGSLGAGRWGGPVGRKSSRMNEMALRHMMTNNRSMSKRFSQYDMKKGASSSHNNGSPVKADMLPPSGMRVGSIRGKDSPNRTAAARPAEDLPSSSLPPPSTLGQLGQVGQSEVDLDDIRIENSDYESEVCGVKGSRRTRKTDTRYSQGGFLLSPPLQPHEAEAHPSFATLWKDAAFLHQDGKLSEADRAWEGTIRHIKMCLDMPNTDSEELSSILQFAQNNRCCVLHDDGQHQLAERKLRKLLSRCPKGEAQNEVQEIIMNYNLAIVLQDRDHTQKEGAEHHFRICANLLVARNGFDEVMTLTAISELALAVFEQARLIESYLLAYRAKRGFVELFGAHHDEVLLTESRLREVFEVEQWYCDGPPGTGADGEEEEVLIEKEPEEALGCFWEGARLEGVTPKTPSAKLKQVVGKELRSVNGVAVTSSQHLASLVAGQCILVLWFEDARDDEEEGSQNTGSVSHEQGILQLPSLGNIPKCVSQYGKGICMASPVSSNASSSSTQSY